MAMCQVLNCSKCDFTVEVWSDGNPYELHDGIRLYVYHPADLSNVVGNAPNHICRDCNEISEIDPKIDKMQCEHCNSENIVCVWDLKNKKCVKCDGILKEDKSVFMIS